MLSSAENCMLPAKEVGIGMCIWREVFLFYLIGHSFELVTDQKPLLLYLMSIDPPLPKRHHGPNGGHYCWRLMNTLVFCRTEARSIIHGVTGEHLIVTVQDNCGSFNSCVLTWSLCCAVHVVYSPVILREKQMQCMLVFLQYTYRLCMNVIVHAQCLIGSSFLVFM